MMQNVVGVQRLREIISILLLHARAIDRTMLVSLISIVAESMTRQAAVAATNLLNYGATHPNGVLGYTKIYI
jgi:hypothetical protein